jgi:hypothetical protein
MEGASGGPRSAAELVAAAQGLRGLLDAGLLSQDRYDAQITAQRAETEELYAAPRPRSSVGDAGSPVPTTGSGAGARRLRTAALRLCSFCPHPPRR